MTLAEWLGQVQFWHWGILAILLVVIEMLVPGTYLMWLGIAAGIVVAALFVLFNSGEPSINPQPVDYAIWFALLGFFGVLNSTAIYFVNAMAIKFVDSVK